MLTCPRRRLVAKTTGEIQQYQNQPYCLDEEPSIRVGFRRIQASWCADQEIYSCLESIHVHVQLQLC